MHPLDLIKTRFQLQTSTSAQYTGVRDCVRKMYAQVTNTRCRYFRNSYK